MERVCHAGWTRNLLTICLVFTLLPLFRPPVFTSALSSTQSATGPPRTLNRTVYSELMDLLMTSRNPQIPPNADNISQPVDVRLFFLILFVHSVDTQNQIMSLSLETRFRWFDPSLAWNTIMFPVDYVYLLPDTIWRPIIVPANTEEGLDAFMKQTLQVKVFHTGQVVWSTTSRLMWTCEQNIRLFPFDQQHCWVMFQTLVQNVDDIRITLAHPYASRFENPSWDLVEVKGYLYVSGNIQYPAHVCVLKRRWMFHVFTIVVPVALVSAMNCIGFLLPAGCGERMSVSVTSFLTLAVLLTYVQSALPNNSKSVCYLSVYLVSQVVLSVACVVVSAFVVRCYQAAPGPQGPDPTADGDPAADDVRLHAGDFTLDADNSEPSVAVVITGTKVGSARALSRCECSPRNSTYDRARLTCANIDWASVGLKVNAICLPLFSALTVASLLTFVALVKLTPHHDLFS